MVTVEPAMTHLNSFLYSAKCVKVLRCHVTVELARLIYSDWWDTFWVLHYVQVLFTVYLLL